MAFAPVIPYKLPLLILGVMLVALIATSFRSRRMLITGLVPVGLTGFVLSSLLMGVFWLNLWAYGGMGYLHALDTQEFQRRLQGVEGVRQEAKRYGQWRKSFASSNDLASTAKALGLMTKSSIVIPAPSPNSTWDNRESAEVGLTDRKQLLRHLNLLETEASMVAANLNEQRLAYDKVLAGPAWVNVQQNLPECARVSAGWLSILYACNGSGALAGAIAELARRRRRRPRARA